MAEKDEKPIQQAQGKKDIEDILAEPSLADDEQQLGQTKEDDLDIEEAVEEETAVDKVDEPEPKSESEPESEPEQEEKAEEETETQKEQPEEKDQPKEEKPKKEKKRWGRKKEKKARKEEEKSKPQSDEAQSRTSPDGAGKGSKLKTIIIVILTMLITAAVVLGGTYIYYKKYMKKTEEPKKEETKVEEPEVAKETVYVNAKDGLKLRKEPSTTSEQLAIIPYGTALEVLETKDGWYKVNYDGKEGWIFAEFTTKEKPADSDWKTYTGHGTVPGPNFSIKYPADWSISGSTVTKMDAGKKYEMVFGQGGIGMLEENGITASSENVSYNGLPAKKIIAKNNGVIFLVSVQFTKGAANTKIDFNLPAGYNPAYLDTFEKVLATFSYS